ncbi:DUF4326 domain-containing protein [Streptomyces fumanus]|uniref:DUF4326 domain-containing protein n=1 Tax=Streptomyces fumanus TaxID=67302 RepID=A0A919A4H5_9ACTN|nr:DUF4326 domain-containing protein [Streptomyces fumanus]GHE84886.1 hypothetical protein GCM10018772_04990 [Streptomyces fumanus]
MTTPPRRIQRRRTKGWRAPDGAIYVGRGSRWGNPARIVPAWSGGLLVQWGETGGAVGTWPADGIEAHRYATELYRRWAERTVGFTDRARAELAGRDLMCWCPLPEPGQPDHCHAAVLLELANAAA